MIEYNGSPDVYDSSTGRPIILVFGIGFGVTFISVNLLCIIMYFVEGNGPSLSSLLIVLLTLMVAVLIMMSTPTGFEHKIKDKPQLSAWGISKFQIIQWGKIYKISDSQLVAWGRLSTDPNGVGGMVVINWFLFRHTDTTQPLIVYAQHYYGDELGDGETLLSYAFPSDQDTLFDLISGCDQKSIGNIRFNQFFSLPEVLVE